ncbi:ICMT-domain-containing protein [Rhizodiscina lignyota]|uniref:Protein-S-isoprenylcysteine O-methyltransferase n=1 Tax=Rhizodiscina lignyota TaxID=1504668 RepID=A0A9P4IK77_9PEZI|nr:ICMT-domain-containing protein [Rhizodiscina lignyota]
MADPLIPNFETTNGDYHHANGHDGGDPQISWPLDRPEEKGNWTPKGDATLPRNTTASPPPLVVFDELLPGHKRSQSGIGLRAFFLGITLGLSIPLAANAALSLEASDPSRAWRVFFLLGALALFHFLEFWTHARFNVPKATTSTFLLFNNGWQYTVANFCALLETTVTSLFFPRWQSHFTYEPVQWGALVVMAIGQLCRSMAMAHAGTSFNHKVQTKKARDHRLVTTGIYAVLRHPSYFGFFWWAVGLQVFLGNAICFWVYLVVLWDFFNHRIAHEEEHLVKFFGDDYVQYRLRTWIGIPFIR